MAWKPLHIFEDSDNKGEAINFIMKGECYEKNWSGAYGSLSRPSLTSPRR
ncbi:hypothetical protein GCM10010954_32450 [Halobacillus andaensis]|uniref:Uncharacterized protein n=1 Tax=Halobacillus andaensis TaxID=1176239 RepID=A0A917B819_HALAA|nr:hypothetical protein GCM10010954_32450 [Halobacillus andaensis]